MGTPQLRSRVIGRGRISSSIPSEKLRTFGRHSGAPSIHERSASANRGKSRNRWLVYETRASSRRSWTADRSDRSDRAGCRSCRTGRRAPPGSRKSARPLDVPVRERMARRRGERDGACACSKIAPCSYSVLNTSWVTRSWFRVVVRVKQSYVNPSLRKSSRMRLVVEVGDLAVALSLTVGRHHHRRAMLVGPAHREDVVPFQAVIARVHVERHVRGGVA